MFPLTLLQCQLWCRDHCRKGNWKVAPHWIQEQVCTACTQNIPKEKHAWFKNWNASSSEMEADIIVEGFINAERVHSVRYTQFIGDGDSSVYPTEFLDGDMPSGSLNVQIMLAKVIEVH